MAKSLRKVKSKFVQKESSKLSISDFNISPVWEYVNDDEQSELLTKPVQEFPILSFDNRLLISKVELPNKTHLWAIVSNLDIVDLEKNQHFLFISLEKNGKWFDLARYHDIGFEKNSPKMLSDILKMDTKEIFPIKLTIDKKIIGTKADLVVTIQEKPTIQYSRSEIIKMAIK